MVAASDRVALPSRWDACVFAAKAWGLRLRRWVRDCLRDEVAFHAPGHALADAPLLAEFRDGLWPLDEVDPRLVAGKLQNLRLAIRRLHAIEPGAGAGFSFWRQVGRATALRKFAQGRELREGCVIPAIGGGLCQLSGAIYDCAVRAGLTVLERHRHSRVIPGSLAEYDRDATVFWNYMDLRLAADFPWRLEVRMDADTLTVAIRGHRAQASAAVPVAMRRRAETSAGRDGDCTTCEQDDCHRHVGKRAVAQRRVWLVDEEWPEFDAYRRAHAADGDRVLRRADGWTQRLGLWRARIVRRYLLWRRQPLPQARQRSDALTARGYADRLTPDDLELVVPQSLLPHLWRAGVLAGRRFDVLMTALPMHEIQRRLDAAARSHAQSPTLVDFRAEPALIAAERDALAQAQRWITPHAQIVDLAGARALRLLWRVPEVRARSEAASPPVVSASGVSRSVFFAASSLARKGVYEFRQAIEGLNLRVLLPPGAWESADLWDGFDVERVATYGDGVARADAVALPAWIEHQPRGLLLAIAAGKPIVATAACGLGDDLPWHRVECGAVDGLRAAILRALGDAPSAS
jgi:hypothetical protein